MINPNKEHLLTGRVILNEVNGVRLGRIESGGHVYEGYNFSKALQAGELVTFRVNFNITADQYSVVRGSVRRKRKPKIVVIDKRHDSFGTLHVKFLGHDGQIKQVSFDEGDWAQWDAMAKRGGVL